MVTTSCSCGVKVTLEGEIPRSHLCFRCGSKINCKAPHKSGVKSKEVEDVQEDDSLHRGRGLEKAYEDGNAEE